MLASNITWNAYNNFGGRSNYINPDRLPPTPTVNARLELKRYTDPDAVTYDTDEYAPLSLERPEPINHIDFDTEITDPIEGRAACHIAPAEWRLLGWLEREQFAYDYYAETQLHDGTLDLDRLQSADHLDASRSTGRGRCISPSSRGFTIAAVSSCTWAGTA